MTRPRISSPNDDLTTTGAEGLQSVVRNLSLLHRLNTDDRAAIDALPFRMTSHAAHAILVREGDRPQSCCILLDGYACRHKTTSAGDRQIVSFHIPGDILDVQHLELERADHNVQAITPCSIAWVSKEDILRLLLERPAVGKAVWRSALVDASIFREWVLNVGRRDALSRVAHMLCEFVARREAAGLGPPDHFELPMNGAFAVPVFVFPLAVTSELVRWPEDHQRERRWLTTKRALKIVDDPAIRKVLKRFAGSARFGNGLAVAAKTK